MDAPVYKKLIDIQNQRENPQGTLVGQEVVSVSETFWTRLAREGQLAGRNVSRVTLPANSTLTISSTGPDADRLFYPRYISISSDVDAELVVQITTGIPQVTFYYPFRVFAKAGTPVIIECDGDIAISNQGNIAIGAINYGSTAGTYTGSIMGYEVSNNA